MKLGLLICTSAYFMQALADPNCSKNAWVRINPDNKNGYFVSGGFTITSGKQANDISQDTLVKAFNACFFDGGACDVNKSSGAFGCKTTTEWKSANWVASGNIEFDCGGFDHHCYDVKWNPT